MIASDALLTDLYQLTMLQGYYRHRMEEIAVFELFVRRLPVSRGFLVTAGLEQAIEYLRNLHFSTADLGWLQGTGFFTADFLLQLESFRFTGDVHALPEGTVFFQGEYWNAVSRSGRIEPGEEVVIEQIEGLKLYVIKKPQPTV